MGGAYRIQRLRLLPSRRGIAPFECNFFPVAAGTVLENGQDPLAIRVLRTNRAQFGEGVCGASRSKIRGWKHTHNMIISSPLAMLNLRRTRSICEQRAKNEHTPAIFFGTYATHPIPQIAYKSERNAGKKIGRASRCEQCRPGHRGCWRVVRVRVLDSGRWWYPFFFLRRRGLLWGVLKTTSARYA